MIDHNETLDALKRMSEEDPNGFSSDILALIDYKYKTAKAEAYKEFAEGFKEIASKCFTSCNGILMEETTTYQISQKRLDNLLKEKVGEDK